MSLLVLILLLLYINFDSIYSNEFINKEWDPELLYEYTKNNYLGNNPEKNNNLKYMIVDPENYLKNNDLSEIIKGMKLLFDKFKINNYIFIISNIEIKKYKRNKTSEIDIDKETERFLSKFNYIMYRENNYYDDSMTLMSIIFINEAKIKIRTGLKLRNIIQEKDLLNIESSREIDLLESRYYKVLKDLINDFHKNYIENYQYYNSFYYQNKNTIIYSIIFILLLIFIIIIFINYIPIGEREQKIKDFLEQNKNFKYKILFKYCCSICLSFFMSEKEKLKIENYLDKDRLKKEKTKILECGHIFHNNCIKDWNKNHKECPLCFIDKHYNENELLLKDVINEYVEIQRKAFPHKINNKQCKRIINNFLKENKAKIL